MPATTTRTRKPVRSYETIGELLAALGGIPVERVRLQPYPGTATKRDLLRLHDGGHGLFELVDGTLVEKPMGRPESHIALKLGALLNNFAEQHKLGFCTGADDLIEILPKLVRGPDVSFTSWLRTPDGLVDTQNQISKIVPNLAVEVLSPKNTRAEMERKLGEYFRGGVRLVWIIDPPKRTAEVYTSPTSKTVIEETGTLDGGDVVPGFRVPLSKLFEQLGPKKSPKRKKK
jgi:Uma2 family endonuclease